MIPALLSTLSLARVASKSSRVATLELARESSSLVATSSSRSSSSRRVERATLLYYSLARVATLESSS